MSFAESLRAKRKNNQQRKDIKLKQLIIESKVPISDAQGLSFRHGKAEEEFGLEKSKDV